MNKTLSGILVDTVSNLLKGATGAGEQVFFGRTWPLRLDQLPALMVDPIYSERREATGKAAPEFDTTTTITIRGRVTAPSAADDLGAQNVADALETLKFELERTIINAYGVMLQIENFPHIDVTFTVTPDAKQPVGELEMTLAMAFREGPEDFVAPDVDALTEVAIYTDLLNVFDALATYLSPPFPQSVTPAPRTAGPDGRTEGGGLHFTNLDQ